MIHARTGEKAQYMLALSRRHLRKSRTHGLVVGVHKDELARLGIFQLGQTRPRQFTFGRIAHRDAHHVMAARHHAQQGMVALLDLPVRIALPPVGLITLRGQRMTPVTAALVECLRDEARLLAQ